MSKHKNLKLPISTAVIFIFFWFPLHLLPTSTTPNYVPYLDKIIHFSIFLVWSFINLNSLKNIKNIILLSGLIAVASETGQLFIPYRNFEAYDILFDMLGVVPVIIYLNFRKFTNKY